MVQMGYKKALGIFRNFCNSEIQNRLKVFKFSGYQRFNFCDKIEKIISEKKQNNEKAEEKTEEKVEISDYDKIPEKNKVKIESEDDRSDRLYRESIKQQLASAYTPEELDKIIEKGDEVVLMEIKEKYNKYLKLAKRLSVFVNLPLSFALMGYCHFGFENLAEVDSSTKIFHHILFLLDYLFFLNGLSILYGCRNIVTFSKFIPKDKTIEFTKLNFFAKPYKVVHKIEDLKRATRSMITPFVSLKNIKTNHLFSLHGVAEWKDIKLFNALFPRPVRPMRTKKDKSVFEL